MNTKKPVLLHQISSLSNLAVCLLSLDVFLLSFCKLYSLIFLMPNFSVCPLDLYFENFSLESFPAPPPLFS